MAYYSELTTANASFIKRFSHGSRFNMAIQLLAVAEGESVLDYGTGDGYLLRSLVQTGADCELVGYEPLMFDELESHLTPELRNVIRPVQSTSELSQFNKVCCLEVLEHLPGDCLISELQEMKRLMANDARLVISVPIEVGIASLLKNIARMLLGQAHGNTNLRTVFKSLFSQPIDRETSDYIGSHIGFDYRTLLPIFEEQGLRICKIEYSPLPLLGSIVNSQVFFVLEKS